MRTRLALAGSASAPGERPRWRFCSARLRPTGGYIFYNTNVLNHYATDDERDKRAADTRSCTRNTTACRSRASPTCRRTSTSTPSKRGSTSAATYTLITRRRSRSRPARGHGSARDVPMVHVDRSPARGRSSAKSDRGTATTSITSHSRCAPGATTARCRSTDRDITAS